MTIEGELIVRLECGQRKVRRVMVRSTRPHAASRVALGRTREEAVATIPSLFGICTHAQGAAAAAALQAAAGVTAPAAATVARDAAVVFETVQEYLWRMLIDWPQAQGHAPAMETVAAARRLLAPELARLVPWARSIDATAEAAPVAVSSDVVEQLVGLATQSVFGLRPREWLALADRQAIAAWAARGSTQPARLLAEMLATSANLGRSDVALMPAADADALRTAVIPAMRADPDFARAPTWAGAPVETGALARMRAQPGVASFLSGYGSAVATRMVARLAELAGLLTWLQGSRAEAETTGRVGAFPLAEAEGCAAVETARGLLLHRARLRDGRVAEYQIVAPTEWNFHPAGPLVRGLEGAPAVDEAGLARDARLLVQALDPCVACRVEVAGA